MTHIIQSADTYKTVKAEFDTCKTVKAEYDTCKTVKAEYNTCKTVRAEYDTYKTVKSEYDIYKTVGLGIQSRVRTGRTPTQKLLRKLLLRFAVGLERVDRTGCEPHGRVKRLSCTPLSSECGT